MNIIYSKIIVYIYIKHYIYGLLDTVSPIIDPLHFVLSLTLYSSYFQSWMKSTKMDGNEIYQIAIFKLKSYFANIN